jgi:hypothetical protein
VSGSADWQDNLIEVLLAARNSQYQRKNGRPLEGRQDFRQEIERIKKTDKTYRSDA